jgi:hypothetical protein
VGNSPAASSELFGPQVRFPILRDARQGALLRMRRGMNGQVNAFEPSAGKTPAHIAGGGVI